MSKIEIYGYHGTIQHFADQIVAKQDFIDSDKDNEWLGTGVYFFAYKAHADWWIKARRFRHQETCVLKAELSFAKDQLLDLDDPEMLEFANSVLKAAVKRTNEEGNLLISVSLDDLPADKRFNMACNIVRELFPEYGITMYTFTPNCKPGITGFRLTQKQICVSDHSIIGKIEIENG